MKRKILAGLIVLVLGLAAASYGVWWWVMLRAVPMQAERIDYIIESGAGPKAMARTMREAGIEIDEDQFMWLARLTEKDTQLQAGAYEAVQGDSMWTLLERMAAGDMIQTRLTLIEGWDYKRIRQALAQNEHVKHTLTEVSDEELLQRLGAKASHPEGLFYPDTYVFVPGTTDYDILRRAYHAQSELLEQMWAERDPDLPLKTPYEALILASIVEKETGQSAERARVAGVFINRLRRGMLLQTDPTVIYGMGDAYQGRIRKRDLQTDTPWNTYTRTGLPPTPIATPSKASLEATLHPEQHDFYYFVARGDGTSEFSRNLNEHNRAVRKYILNRN